jgi:hypothetical protein
MFFQQSHEMQRKSTKKKLVLYLPDVGASDTCVACRVLSFFIKLIKEMQDTNLFFFPRAN